MVYSAVRREIEAPVSPREARVRCLMGQAKEIAKLILERHHGQTSSEELLELIVMEAFLAGYQKGTLDGRNGS